MPKKITQSQLKAAVQYDPAMFVVAPGLAYLAAERLPPILAVLAGAVLGVSGLAFAMWHAYRDSLP